MWHGLLLRARRFAQRGEELLVLPVLWGSGLQVRGLRGAGSLDPQAG